MKITDAEVLKEIKKVKSPDLESDIADYPDDEREGRSDIQFLADELSWILSNYQDEGHSNFEELQEARRILRQTKNGKVIPLWKSTLKPVYDRVRIECCKNTVNEYNRLKSLMKRLNNKGIYGKW